MFSIYMSGLAWLIKNAARGRKTAAGQQRPLKSGTTGRLTSRRGRFQSANPVVSHLPIEIRCNLY